MKFEDLFMVHEFTVLQTVKDFKLKLHGHSSAILIVYTIKLQNKLKATWNSFHIVSFQMKQPFTMIDL